MTIKELYEWAKAHDLENAPLKVSYTCDDDTYNYDGDVKEIDLTVSYKNIVIDIVN